MPKILKILRLYLNIRQKNIKRKNNFLKKKLNIMTILINKISIDYLIYNNKKMNSKLNYKHHKIKIFKFKIQMIKLFKV